MGILTINIQQSTQHTIQIRKMPDQHVWNSTTNRWIVQELQNYAMETPSESHNPTKTSQKINRNCQSHQMSTCLFQATFFSTPQKIYITHFFDPHPYDFTPSRQQRHPGLRQHGKAPVVLDQGAGEAWQGCGLGRCQLFTLKNRETEENAEFT